MVEVNYWRLELTQRALEIFSVRGRYLRDFQYVVVFDEKVLAINVMKIRSSLGKKSHISIGDLIHCGRYSDISKSESVSEDILFLSEKLQLC